jgi:hypothetical protein
MNMDNGSGYLLSGTIVIDDDNAIEKKIDGGDALKSEGTEKRKSSDVAKNDDEEPSSKKQKT